MLIFWVEETYELFHALCDPLGVIGEFRHRYQVTRIWVKTSRTSAASYLLHFGIFMILHIECCNRTFCQSPRRYWNEWFVYRCRGCIVKSHVSITGHSLSGNWTSVILDIDQPDVHRPVRFWYLPRPLADDTSMEVVVHLLTTAEHPIVTGTQSFTQIVLNPKFLCIVSLYYDLQADHKDEK